MDNLKLPEGIITEKMWAKFIKEFTRLNALTLNKTYAQKLISGYNDALSIDQLMREGRLPSLIIGKKQRFLKKYIEIALDELQKEQMRFTNYKEV